MRITDILKCRVSQKKKIQLQVEHIQLCLDSYAVVL